MLKQQTCAPPSYPPRAAVGDPDAWDDKGYEPRVHEAPILTKDPRPAWADAQFVDRAEMASRLTYVGGSKTTVGAVCVLDSCTQTYHNPKGKTGLRGRGLLGRWGPNHAADCLVTRLDPQTGDPQVLVVERVDGDNNSSLAWPAGMVEPGDDVPATLRAELTQEALKDSDAVDRLFGEGRRGVVYRGWVDDHRNTDEAWMETTAVHFHADAEVAAALELATRDTHEVRKSFWMNVADINAMYASHYEWLCKLRDEQMPLIVAEQLGVASADELRMEGPKVTLSPAMAVGLVGVGLLALFVSRC